MNVKRIISTLAMLTVLVMGGAAMTADAQPGYQPEPVLQAKDLVATELLKGPHYTVDSRVPVKDFVAHFTIRSDYGTFKAHGIRMFQVRVREVYALTQLDQMSQTKEFAEAAAQAVARPLTSAVNMIVNPVETVEGLPGGVSRLFGRIELGAESLASAATAPGQSGEQQVASVSERVGTITVDALGYQKERRDLAKSLGVDPYTTNPVLAKKLDDMARVAFSGRFVIQTAMTVLVPGSTIMSAVSITNSSIYDTPAGDLINSDKAIFAATGASPAQVTALMKNPQYSVSLLTDLALGVRRLQGVNGLASVVPFAAIAKTQDETNFVTSAVNMLARYNESTERLTLVTAPGPVLGRGVSGRMVVAGPVDYVAWTQRAAHFAERDDLKTPNRLIWLSGQMDRRADKEVTARGWTVFESFTIAAER
jgi:hypothetical protein